MKNYYAILEVPVGSSLEEIRQAYRRLAQENLDDAEAFAELKEAHEALANPTRRAEYDLEVWGETFVHGGAASPPLPAALGTAERVGRCPMGAEDHCPVLQMRVAPTDNFCPECGYLLNALGDGSFDLSAEIEPPRIWLEEAGGRVHLLHPGISLVGREVAEVLLPDKTVSRQHARLEVIGNGEITIEDLSSTNGTQINDQPLVPHFPRQIAGNDRIRFGNVLTTLHLPEPEEVPIPHTLDGEGAELDDAARFTILPSPPARARLVETREAASDEAAPREFLLAPGVTTFGRRTENTVVLQGDPYVSGSHAQIIADGDMFRLIDVGSTNGTLINGERLAINEPVLLASGDLIVIGGTALRFEPISAEETKEEILSQNEPAPAVQMEG